MLTRETSIGPISVLAIVPTLATGGAERQLLALCQHVDRCRFSVEVVCYEDAGLILDQMRQVDIPVTYLDRARLGAVGLLRALRREIRRRRPHVLVCRLPSAYRFGRIAALGAGVPATVAEERTVLGGPWLRRRLDRVLNRWTQAWVGNSRAVANHVVADLGVPAERVHVIYNGVDEDRFRNAAPLPALEALRREGQKIVLNVGNLREPKNQRLFLCTCRDLCIRSPGVVPVICGEGALREELRTFAVELGLGEACRFLGAVPDTAPVLASADVLVQTSDREGLPNAVMEAMAAGVPVVATDVGGTRELVEDGQSGFLVPAGDLDALVSRVRAVLNDPAMARRLADRAAHAVHEKFTMQAMARAYEDLFERLVRSKDGGEMATARDSADTPSGHG